MPTIPQRIASAFAVLCGRYGDVTEMAKDREQSRQSLYREAEQVADAVDGAAAQARIDELQRQLAEQQAEVQALQERLKHAVEITPDKQHEFATVAQAEGVSLSVARRLLRVVDGVARPLRAWRRWGGRPSRPASAPARLLEVLDEAARPEVEAGHRRRDFFGRKPVLMVVEPESLCWMTGRMVKARDGVDMGRGIRPIPGARGRGPRRRHGPGQRGEARACPPSRRRPARPRRHARRLPYAPRRGACLADDLGRGHPRPGARRRGPEGTRPASAVRGNRARVMARR